MTLLNGFGIFIVILGIFMGISSFYNSKIPANLRFKIAMGSIGVAAVALLVVLTQSMLIALVALVFLIGLIWYAFHNLKIKVSNGYVKLLSRTQQQMVVRAMLMVKLNQQGKISLSDDDLTHLQQAIDQAPTKDYNHAKSVVVDKLQHLTDDDITRLNHQLNLAKSFMQEQKDFMNHNNK